MIEPKLSEYLITEIKNWCDANTQEKIKPKSLLIHVPNFLLILKIRANNRKPNSHILNNQVPKNIRQYSSQSYRSHQDRVIMITYQVQIYYHWDNVQLET